MTISKCAMKFNRILPKVVKDNAAKFIALVITPSDFGTHSIQKGVARFVATKCAILPSMASICLRANWKSICVKDR